VKTLICFDYTKGDNMQEMLLKDGVRYYQHTPEKEEELELLVKKYQKEIFGEDAILFDIKQKIKSETGRGTIPDAYLFKTDTEEFFLVEIELSSHPEYSHITEQVGRFLSALKDWKTRQKIASILKVYITSDIVLEKFTMDKIGTRDIYQYFLENVLEKIEEQTSQVIIVIDRITPEIREACGILRPNPRILEFKSYTREDAESVRIYQFTPSYKHKGPKPPPPPPEMEWSKMELFAFLKERSELQTAFLKTLSKIKEKLHADELIRELKSMLGSEFFVHIGGALGGLNNAINRQHKEYLYHDGWDDKGHFYEMAPKYKDLIYEFFSK